jgi:hypothetical protein
MSTTLHQASSQWASRPSDERFVSLDDMANQMNPIRKRSKMIPVNMRELSVKPDDQDETHKGLVLVSPSGREAAFTNFAFGQVSALAGAPKGYLSTLPVKIAADALNFGLQDTHADLGLFMTQFGNGEDSYLQARAFTSPEYGRIYNVDIVNALRSRFGDGTGKDSDWKVPGEFGKDVPITKANTTLFAGDRDMFVFLCDEKNRIELPNRRDGKSGDMARGFFVSNSEVGYGTLSVTFFLFDYVCCNRIVWGATEVKNIAMRHRSGIIERFADEVAPILAAYSKSSAVKSIEHLRSAQSQIIDSSHDKVLEFLADKFGTMKLAKAIDKIHLQEESRPVSTLWDAVTGATAYARTIDYQDERVKMEREAGKLLNLVA